MWLSQRSELGGETNALAVATQEARASGRPLLDLTESNPTRTALPYDADMIIGPLRDENALRYSPSPFGIRSAREAIGETYDVDPSRVVLTASTSEAYATLLTVLCDPGDRVLSPQPSYPLLSHLASLSGVALTPYHLAWDGRWHVDAASIRDGSSLGAKAILAVSPNNPTGSVLDDDDLSALDTGGLPTIVDEVFAVYPLEGDVRTAFSTERPRIVVGGLSKLAGLPQMKVGWILVGGDDAFARAILPRLELALDAYLSLSTPAQLALPRWLASRATVVDAIRARTRHNLDTLRALLRVDSPITIPPVEAGWYACLRVPRTRTDEAWALHLLEADDVLVQPGYFYDFAEDGWLVVSLLTPEDQFADGASRLVARVEMDAG